MKITRRAVLAAAGAASVQVQSAEAPLLKLPRPVRVAIWGFEGHTEEILATVPRMEGASLVAYCETDAAELEKWQKSPKLVGAKPFADPRRMLDAGGIDVVAVCNDNGGRAAAIVECAQRRLPVMSEKPVAITLEQLSAVKKAVSENNVPLGCLLRVRSEPWALELHDLRAAGKLGEVLQAASQKSYKFAGQAAWKKDPATYGGTLPWIGIDLIDLMMWTSGQDFTSVSAADARLGVPELGSMESVAACVFRLQNGGVATLRLDYLRQTSAPTHGDMRLRLAGNRAVAEYQEAAGVTFLGAAGPQELRRLPPQGWPFVDFLASVYLGRPRGISERDIFRATEVALLAQKSAKDGTVVQL